MVDNPTIEATLVIENEVSATLIAEEEKTLNLESEYVVGYIGQNVDVDDALSTESENPVQNKVITKELNKIHDKIDDIEDDVNDIKDEINNIHDDVDDVSNKIDNISNDLSNRVLAKSTSEWLEDETTYPQGTLLIYMNYSVTADGKPIPAFKVADGANIPRDLLFTSTENIIRLSHSLTIGEYVYDGSEDVSIPVYDGGLTDEDATTLDDLLSEMVEISNDFEMENFNTMSLIEDDVIVMQNSKNVMTLDNPTVEMTLTNHGSEMKLI